MNKSRIIISSFILFACFFTVSCLNTIVEVKNWMEATSVEEIEGNYHYLENDGIKIYLPEVFERYSSVGYQQLLDSFGTKKEVEFEKKRLKALRDIEGSFYIYFDKETGATYTINTLPYTPLRREDAQYLLSMINASYKRSSHDSDLSYTKLTAKYNDSGSQNIFRSIYRIDNQKTNIQVFNSSYIISSKSKTVWIQITTPFEVDFDMFIQKMIL
ncbi:hypothetical protein M0G43_14480 [Subsaxibacter sp. CAU 1640]|uniref:hypothetical protein n=1 Tax=Subsaxibacter sp. CAU 1640 TaxID=2933271 RepID=UPI002005AF1A|nr:hypothetical protein [Subsaxibacter sp. CAU 1640]MCK7591793.1 hypothetical protein [Subsaxibacter sp. CAU 1640]